MQDQHQILLCLFLLLLYSYFWMNFPIPLHCHRCFYIQMVWWWGSRKVGNWDCMNSCGISKTVPGVQVRKLGKERTPLFFPISSIMKWKSKSSKIDMRLLCLLLLIWFCISFFWKIVCTWNIEKPGDKSLFQRTLCHFSFLHLHERRQVCHSPSFIMLGMDCACKTAVIQLQ